MYDHMHVTYKTPSGEIAHIEAGLSPTVETEEFRKLCRLTVEEADKWVHDRARSFGLPEECEILHVTLGG